ncbi:MAG: HD domain-containing protein [Candidatus Aminicenantes bacterium]|nr:HD domain-containing protein [Candidatus Aminicenantes bacterium]
MNQRISAPSTEILREIHQAGVEIIVRFNSLLKLGRLYSVKNVLFQEQLGLLYKRIKDNCQEEEATLKIREGTFFFRNVRLRFIFANYPAFKTVLQELTKREVAVISFLPELTESELETFIACLLKAEGYNQLLAGLDEAQIVHIQIEKGTERTSLTGKKEKDRATARIYFSSLLHLKDAFEAEDPHQALRLNTTRRLMQALFTHIVDNEAFVFGLTNIKNFDEYTLNHSINVCLLSIALGRRLGLDRNELIELGISAFFHDFGKIETPKEILDKPAKLEPHERAVIEKHPYHGAGTLALWREIKGIPLRAIHVAMEHHIKEDLSGYPQTFKKRPPHLFSKIVKIVDYFDAITTKRVYRPRAFTREEALSLMMDQGDKEFHPLLLRIFIQMMGFYPIGSVVALNTGEIGLVVETNPDPALTLRPKVKIIADKNGQRIDGPVVDLAEKDPISQRYLRTIVKGLDPEKYNIRPADYFMASTLA